jgi:hypothetical protein
MSDILVTALSVLIFFPAALFVWGVVLLYAFCRVCGTALRNTFRRRPETGYKNIRERNVTAP